MHASSESGFEGRRPLAVVVLTLALAVTGASYADTFGAETRLALPAGFSLTSTEGVATVQGRHALTISEHGQKTTSRVMQVTASGTVFTDVEGLADWVEFSADRTHLLVRQTLPEDDPRHAFHLYSVIDNAGEVVWSTASKAPYRFTAGGNLLYVAQFPGDVPHIRVFDLSGRLIKTVVPPAAYLDARVLEGADEALVLFSAPRSRSTDPRGGREVAVARVRLDEGLPTVWRVPLDQDALKYPELIPLNRDWVLITTQQGYIAVSSEGEASRFGPDASSGAAAGNASLADMRPAAGGDGDSLILYGRDRTLVLDLAGGGERELAPDPNSRFEDVGYRDQHVVLAHPGEVILRPLDEQPGFRSGVRRQPANPRKDAGRTKQR